MPAFTNGPAQLLDGRVAKILCAAVVSTLSVASAPGGTVLAQDASTIAQKPPPGSAEARRREEWRASIQRTPLPRNGCFTAAFPATNWQEVPCGKAPAGPATPARRATPFVDNSNSNESDNSAQTTGTILSAEGSFDAVSGVTSERDAGANNNYDLQLNTSQFQNQVTKALCAGAADPSRCKGWQQFIFANFPASINFHGCSVFGGGACAFIEYVLVDYRNQCPSDWQNYGTSCYRRSDDAVSVRRQEVGGLGGLKLFGTAGGTSDIVAIVTADDVAQTLSAPSLLGLNGSSPAGPNPSTWQSAEFNIFGNCCGTEAGFNIGSTITVRTSINDGTSNAPMCVPTSTTSDSTGETNNLSIVGPCTAAGGASPSISFTESFLGPAAAFQPLFVSDYHDQQHFTYLDTNGEVWDAYSCPDCDDAPWRLQQINGSGSLTGAPVAMSAPSVGVFSTADQQHFAYLAANGAIVDVFYCPQCSGGQWRGQQINLGGSGVANGPAAVTAPFVNEFAGHEQQHFAYVDANGAIFDAYYCPKCSGDPWKLQQINGPGGLTDAPIALTQPFVSTYAAHDQQHFAYLSTNGDLWDVYYCPQCSGDRWRKQQLNLGGGVTDAPAAVSAPFVGVYVEADQQHFAYLAANGEIWDVYYCPRCSGNPWKKQQINRGGVTDGPEATSGPFVSEYLAGIPTGGVHNQQHFAYTTKGGDIEDAFYCADCGGGQWKLQEITAGTGSVTNRPRAYFSQPPFIDVNAGHDQQHFAYVAASGEIWDAYYCPKCGSGEWKLQQISAAVTP